MTERLDGVPGLRRSETFRIPLPATGKLTAGTERRAAPLGDVRLRPCHGCRWPLASNDAAASRISTTVTATASRSTLREPARLCGAQNDAHRPSKPRGAQSGLSSPALLCLVQAGIVFFHAAVPVSLHLLGRRDFQRAHHAEAEELRVGVIPDALRELRVLALPLGG